MKREYKLFIQDILDAINDVDKFIEGMDLKDFCRDEKTRSAVVWKIETIGEATKNLPQSIRTKYKDIPWKDMAKIRDKIAHFYFGIDYDIVWKVIKERLPAIKPAVERMLRKEKGK